jgi:phosphoribosylglycinamide formyltransferase-1
MSKPIKLGILGSGKGSNFRAIQEAIEQKKLSAEIAIVLSDMEHAGILDLARQRGLKAVHVNPGKFRTKMEPAAEQKCVDLLREAGVELIVLAGFMRMLKETLLKAFTGRVINIHPSLLPAFAGLEAWRQALEYGVRYTGCTVHYVTGEMDAGPIIGQAIVPVMPDDTPETLHARIQVEEHRLYPQAIQWVAEGKLTLSGRRVLVRN